MLGERLRSGLNIRVLACGFNDGMDLSFRVLFLLWELRNGVGVRGDVKGEHPGLRAACVVEICNVRATILNGGTSNYLAAISRTQVIRRCGRSERSRERRWLIATTEK